MSCPTLNDRHLNDEGIHQYLASGVSAVVKIEGSPVVYLLVDPINQRISLRTPQQRNTLPDLTVFRHLSAEIVHWEEQSWCQLNLTGEVINEAYSILYAVADSIQLEKQGFAQATRNALEAFQELLAGDSRMSDEQELGLMGELLLLAHIIRNSNARRGLGGWRGALSEEHDFDFEADDIEVKTTSGELRHHWISSVTQLSPTKGRRLWLVSIQLTAAGDGGFSLPEIIDRTSALLVEDDLLQKFKGMLRKARWNEAASHLFTRRMRLRTPPAIFEVTEEFPALTPSKLAEKKLQGRVLQIKYLIDLTGLGQSVAVPSILKHFGA